MSASKPLIKDLGRALIVALCGMLLVVILTFGVAVPVEIAREHEAQKARIRILYNENVELEKRRHMLFRSDPLFADLSYMLQAFASFRNAARVAGGYDCAVYITAPKETFDLALMVGNLSVGPVGLCNIWSVRF